MNRDELLKIAKENLSQKRYEHTLAVEKLALELAEVYHADKEAVSAAAILHDVTKEADDSVQLQIIENSDIINFNLQDISPKVYHSITAYLYAKEGLNIQNSEVLNAVRYHTTGRANMSLVEKIIYTADTVSYDRSYSNVNEIRMLAFSDLDKAMAEILAYTINKLVGEKQMISPDTVFCYNEICKRGI